MTVHIDTLVIPTAGAGTRLRPATYVTPKELLRLVDRPIIWYLLKEAHVAGIMHVIIVTHSDAPATRIFFESEKAKHLLEELPGLSVSFVEVTTRGGDGEAILAAQAAVGATAFAVSMGDLLTLPGESILAELVAEYHISGKPIISVEEVDRSEVGSYGIIKTTHDAPPRHRIGGIVEKPTPENTPSTLAMTGKYILPSEIFDDLEAITKERVAPGEVKLAHALNRYAARSPLYALEPKAKHYDTGTKTSLLETEIVFALTHAEIGEKVREFLREHK